MEHVCRAAVAGLLLVMAAEAAASAPPKNELIMQWADSAEASSQYGASNCTSPCWHVRDALGAPDVVQCGQVDSHAWTPWSSYEAWLLVTYKRPVYASGLSIYESNVPGFVQKVQLVDTNSDLRDVVFRGFWYGGKPDTTTCDPYTNTPGALAISFPARDYLVLGAKIWTRRGGNEAVDAVQLQGWTLPGKATPPQNSLNSLFNQWATSANASSSYSTTGLMGSWSAIDAAGAPDVAEGQCGDFTQAWSPAGKGPEPEWLLLMYDTPTHATGVSIHETNIGGFVRKIELLDTNNKYHSVFEGPDNTPCGGWLTVPFLLTKYKVVGVRILTQVDGCEEIDAVRLSGFSLPAGFM